MATVAGIRDALKTRLSTISGLQVHDTVPGQLNPPAAVIRRRSGPKPSTLGGETHDYTFLVTVVTSLADDRAAQDKLDSYLSGTGATSIIAAIDGDVDLGDTVNYAQVTDIEADQVIEVGNLKYLAADIVVEIGAV